MLASYWLARSSDSIEQKEGVVKNADAVVNTSVSAAEKCVTRDMPNGRCIFLLVKLHQFYHELLSVSPNSLERILLQHFSLHPSCLAWAFQRAVSQGELMNISSSPTQPVFSNLVRYERESTFQNDC